MIAKSYVNSLFFSQAFKRTRQQMALLFQLLSPTSALPSPSRSPRSPLAEYYGGSATTHPFLRGIFFFLGGRALQCFPWALGRNDRRVGDGSAVEAGWAKTTSKRTGLGWLNPPHRDLSSTLGQAGHAERKGLRATFRQTVL